MLRSRQRNTANTNVTAKPIRTLQDAADDDQIIAVRCNLCRRLINYLATDLIQVLNPSRPVDAPPFACSRCGTASYMDVSVKTPSAGDYGHQTIHRLLDVRSVLEWGNRTLGDEIRSDSNIGWLFHSRPRAVRTLNHHRLHPASGDTGLNRKDCAKPANGHCRTFFGDVISATSLSQNLERNFGEFLLHCKCQNDRAVWVLRNPETLTKAPRPENAGLFKLEINVNHHPVRVVRIELWAAIIISDRQNCAIENVGSRKWQK